MFRTIEGAADCEIRCEIRFLKAGMCYQVRFVTRSVKCMVQNIREFTLSYIPYIFTLALYYNCILYYLGLSNV